MCQISYRYIWCLVRPWVEMLLLLSSSASSSFLPSQVAPNFYIHERPKFWSRGGCFMQSILGSWLRHVLNHIQIVARVDQQRIDTLRSLSNQWVLWWFLLCSLPLMMKTHKFLTAEVNMCCTTDVWWGTIYSRWSARHLWWLKLWCTCRSYHVSVVIFAHVHHVYVPPACTTVYRVRFNSLA